MIVIARRYGQLGNRLFLYAHLLAAARHYGVELRNPCFAEYASLFPSTKHDLWCRYDAHLVDQAGASSARALDTVPRETRQTRLREPSQLLRNSTMHTTEAVAKTMNAIGMRHYPFEVIRLKPGEHCDLEGERFRMAVESGRTLLLQGWMFRSSRLLNAHWSNIRDFFALSQSDRAAVDSTIDRARQDCDVLVGVHIRRGDYAGFQGGRYFYDDQRYARWMSQVVEQMPGRRVRFLVCTHEGLDEAKYAGMSITRGPGNAIRDLYALAETDWMLGPPSTFTGWAAFIGKRARVELGSAEQSLVVPKFAIEAEARKTHTPAA